ncbi:aminomethyl transferase family protein [Aestuariicoccus sp. MJ-SS9]|uniref:aminomethyl transferase family protein n=1 Tax=Aestuariicoccus sp. MJ-SS9 TaxID=3079855 RepID=UPI0029115FC7|nr:aminomethyl transferase family protein [Aestuariicoccus sp. MJ-SS9]MDU8913840.1 aminomethyl transferase family protein [Aestuariicoccus sp. MJ-SS9]
MKDLSQGMYDTMTSLQQKIDASGGVLNMLRASPMGHAVFPGIPAEFTNWRDEQRAWHEGVVLFEQSYHMTELHLRGADAKTFVTRFATNNLSDLHPLRAKQMVMVDEAGFMISDAILFCEADDFLRVVGPPTASNWLQYQAEKTDLAVEATRDENMIVPRERRDVFRFQLQGPNALSLVREVAEGPMPDIKFFHVGEFKIAGQTVRALRHGMAGQPGFEIYGPWEAQAAVRARVEEAGAAYGLRKAGAVTYPTAAQESGWMPRPFPAIFRGEDTRGFREWLSAKSFEGNASLGGSLVSDDLTDYLTEPYELGYGRLVHFEHDFYGRDALMKRKADTPRAKVTLEWNNEDVFRVLQQSLRIDGPRTKFLALPIPMYATFQYDAVQVDGRTIGSSQWLSYSSNAGALLSTALIDPAEAQIGREVTLLWGEPGSRRASVEAHEVTGIRAKIAPVPYFEKSIKKD